MLTDERPYLRPLNYPWAYEFSEDHRRMNWTREEVRTLHEDVVDWKAMTEEERFPLQYLLNYFVQADVDVGASYFERLAKHYKQPELRMAIGRIIDREITHVDNYDMLPDQFGIPRTEYAEMLNIDVIAEQRLAMMRPAENGCDVTNRLFDLTTHLCGEGISLYGIFIMLLSPSRFGKMKCLGQEIVSWSSRDENHHCFFLTKLFNTELEENPDIDMNYVREMVSKMFTVAVARGAEYAASVFARGPIQGITVAEVETFLKQLANVRLSKLNLGIDKLFTDVSDILELSWAMELMSSAMTNFFEASNTEYQIGSLTGEWEYPPMDTLKDSDLDKFYLEN